MRRASILAGLAALLMLSDSASASLEPVPRSFGGRTIPRVRSGRIAMPTAGAALDRVIVTLKLPPVLAADLPRFSAFGRPVRKVDLASTAARAYLARVNAAQRRAIATLHREIPAARVSWRYRLVLDGMTVTLPTRDLTKLFELGFVHKVYPSLTYTPSLDQSTSIIGAPQLAGLTGARGDGIKIAIVDDGIDQTNPFFDPAGFHYPAGFPKGERQFTSPKVIVAKSFPGPFSGPQGKLPLDPNVSFHGTAVAGVAAGDAGTTAPASGNGDASTGSFRCKLAEGGCHPEVHGLTGVAPRAWLGNYRVFTVKDPLVPPLGANQCCTANTPEIAAAFEAAVADGMDVINFSGGGAESDPRSDALIEATDNVAKGGVVAVIAAGNDRDLFGDGSVGSPGTAPDAIGVAAVENTHVFGPALTVVSPAAGPQPIPFVEAGAIPLDWQTTAHTLLDVGTLTGTDGRPVDRLLCGSGADPNDASSTTLPPGSLVGVVVLVSEGGCTFDSKAQRALAAGAMGMILVDDKPGEANAIPGLPMPAGVVADLDGARLRAAMAGNGGKASILLGHDIEEISTHRNGSTPTSFSSSGLTDFGHLLKPDVSAPGAQILSSTLAQFAGSQFAELDGTSFASPHVAGAAALLLENHPSWTAAEVKSALMSTARPAFADTADTTEAPVTVEGAGVAWLPAANDPRVFTAPQSLSFQYLDVGHGAASRSIPVAISDAGGGAGTWSVALEPQSASAGASIDVESPISLAPGGSATVQVTASASASAAGGEDYGFVVLTNGSVTRRIPYAFLVERPGLAAAGVQPLKAVQSGTTATGVDLARSYRWPSAPFSINDVFGLDQPVLDDGKEKVYSIDIPKTAVNVGVAVTSPARDLGAPVQTQLNAPIHPWFLGSLDENDVQGYAGTPVNANGDLPDFLFDIGVAGTVFAQPGRYYVSVDSGHDPFTGKSQAGPYVLRSWVNDTKPPTVQLITSSVGAGRPSLAIRAVDRQSGVDPFALEIGFEDLLFGASMYDPATGIAVFPFPNDPTTKLKRGAVLMRIVAADYQETKNTNTVGKRLLPNTTFKQVRVRVLDGPTIAWLEPLARSCVSGRTKLLAIASDSKAISSVGFFVGGRAIGRAKANDAGVYSVAWQAGRGSGARKLTAVVSDTAGRQVQASRVVRACGT